jgi:lipoyl synthase
MPMKSQNYKKKIRLSELTETKNILRRFNLHSVCEESRCPNISECFSRKTTTFLILGDICTRNCSFCSVKKGRPDAVDEDEPRRVALAVEALKINYVVITSVTRDDLPDGGSGIFRKTIEAVRQIDSSKKIEVLIPDFQGSEKALKTVIDASPDVIAHNVETVPRLYPEVRGGGNYQRSLHLLKALKRMNPEQKSKSGFMLGLGETEGEVRGVMKDVIETDCDFLSIGQYFPPLKTSYPVDRYLSPEEFIHYGDEARNMGFRHVESGVYVRSSYNASRYLSSPSSPP